jgi:hypothetical protein
MESGKLNGCAEGAPNAVPHFAGLRGAEGLEISDHLFLLSLLPCCAQLALPYWAKVTGGIWNRTARDLTAVVSVTLFDIRHEVLAHYSDTVLLDAGDRSNFEVKLVEFGDRTVSYRLEIDTAEGQ